MTDPRLVDDLAAKHVERRPIGLDVRAVVLWVKTREGRRELRHEPRVARARGRWTVTCSCGELRVRGPEAHEVERAWWEHVS